jgi:hypothetical protein
LQPPGGKSLGAERNQLSELLGRVSAGQRLRKTDFFILRLMVLEQADRGAGEDPPPEPARRRKRRERAPDQDGQAAWLQLYRALVRETRSHGCANSAIKETPAESCRQLLERITAPPRANAPEAIGFQRALEELHHLLEQQAAAIPEPQLRRLAALEDVFEDVVYYLEDDPRYDAGHDFIAADYSVVRDAAQRELQRRGSHRAQ